MSVNTDGEETIKIVRINASGSVNERQVVQTKSLINMLQTII